MVEHWLVTPEVMGSILVRATVVNYHFLRPQDPLPSHLPTVSYILQDEDLGRGVLGGDAHFRRRGWRGRRGVFYMTKLKV